MSNVLNMKFLDRLRNRRIQRQKRIDNLLEKSVEVQKQRIQSRENMVKEAIKTVPSIVNRCPYINGQNTLSEFIRDDSNNSGSTRFAIAVLTLLGFFLFSFLFLYFYRFNLSIGIAFEMWKIMAFIAAIVIGAYFYNKIKMKSPF